MLLWRSYHKLDMSPLEPQSVAPLGLRGFSAKPLNNPSHQGASPLDPHAYLGALNLEDSINAPLSFGKPHQVGTVMANFARHQMCLENGGVEVWCAR